jgi:folylpolyglutamate synthase/dihydropteroate synthase
MNADDLCALASRYCDNCVAISNAVEAVDTALGEIDGYDCMLVCGSLYLAGEVRMKLIEKL